ncbi:cyclase family protein [Alkaliphilus metalliredigens QYMF]|uniref:Cyclase family protein n=1 Tax=Alkaliphilus metalliredigens (strain QYMF) TaxID=293826 RepID=A6TL47_ALKMQ|nr:cyclase family protein [Alkaliphilus metalliredigens]ABR46915.1 cyclase family protein [Alkaliphilus metalliredigens QYMF]
MNILDLWKDVKTYDLTQNLSHLTPPWPTYEPLQIKFFKRLSPHGANGQLITTSNHVGTHLDGPLHFDTAGRDIASLPLDKLVGPGVVVDLSDIAEDYGIYTPKDITDRVEVKKGDILIINTGYHKYGWDQPEADERRYMLRHPGPSMDFIDWIKEMEIKWIGVDCGSADHPMNTKIREWEPGEALQADAYLQEKYGKALEEIYSWPQTYQAMHTKVFPKPYEIIHAENVGGQLNEVLNRRLIIGCFPWKFVGGESSICRILAFDTES